MLLDSISYHLLTWVATHVFVRFSDFHSFEFRDSFFDLFHIYRVAYVSSAVTNVYAYSRFLCHLNFLRLGRRPK